MKVVLHIMAVIGLFGCAKHEPVSDKGAALARVHNTFLHAGDLKDIIPVDVSSEDSSLIVNAYIERWVRDQLLLTEAERNVPSDLDIEALVSDYRASLLKSNYEKQLIREKRDSIITDDQASEFYESSKDQFILSNTVVRCYFIRVPSESTFNEALGNDWADELDTDAFVELIGDADIRYLLDDSTWYNWNHIISWLPKSIADQRTIRVGREYENESEGFKYYFYIFEMLKDGEIAPMAYVREQIETLILHKRDLRIIEDKKEELFERDSRNNQVKIY